MVDELNLDPQDYQDVCDIIEHLIETGRTPQVESVGDTLVITAEPLPRPQAQVIHVDFKRGVRVS